MKKFAATRVGLSPTLRYEVRRDERTGMYWILDQLSQLPVHNPITNGRREFATDHAAKLYTHDLNHGIRAARSA